MGVVQNILIAFGLMFILVGMTISIAADGTYEPTVAPLYSGMVWLFYGYLAYLFVATLISALKALVEMRRP